MTILNASNSSISLDYQAWLQVPNNIVDDEALQTLIHSPTQFAEIFGGGWRVDYFGTFNNYGFFDGNKVLYPESATVTSITATNNGNAFIDWTELSWNPMLNYKSGQELNADILAGNDTIIGSRVSDKLAGFAGDDSIDGGSGTDTAKFTLQKADYQITKTASGFTVKANTGTDGTDTLTSIERLQFSDKTIAFDLDSMGNVGQAMEFIGVVAPSLLNSTAVRGAIISLFDQGQTMESISQLALDYNLLPKASNTALANAVYQNVIGQTANKDMTNMLVEYIEGHGQANFVATIANMHINVDLVGFQQTGVEFF